MKNQIYCRSLGCLVILVLAVTGCAPKAEVKVQFIETRTSLENQVLGTYKQIGQEAWMISSVRATDQAATPLSPSKKEVFRAIENQEFNSDDITEFKDEGLIGESSNGELVLGDKLSTLAPARLSLVREIIAEENQDRLTIIRRIIMENPQLRPESLEAVRQAFASIFWQKAAPHHWLITSEGQWLMKKDWK